MQFKEFVRVREEKFGAVIFETLKEKVYVTNETGKEILSLLKEGKILEEIVDTLADKYNEDRVVVERDVKGFLDGLIEKGLVSYAAGQ